MTPVPLATTHQIKDTCLCLAAQRAARMLARRFDAAFRPVGLTNGQFSLLNALNRPSPASVGAVADLLAIDRTTLTAALKPLARRGLVVSRRDPEDARARLVALTAKGRVVLARAVPIWRREHARLEHELVGIETLREGLTRIRGSL